MSLKDILKNKKVNLTILLSLILIICIIFPIYILYNRQLKTPSENENDNNKEDEETESTNNKSENVQDSTTSYTYGEDCIYYETEKGYIGNNYEDNDKVRIQLKNSSKHFTLNFETNGELLDELDKTYILTNLENEYCRLNTLFNHNLSELINVTLHYSETDSLNEPTYEGSWSGLGGYPNIDIFHNYISYSKYTEERYQTQAHVLSHELIHIFQYSIKKCRLPNWYEEGMANVYAEPNKFFLIQVTGSSENNPQINDFFKEQIKNNYPDQNDLNINIPLMKLEDLRIAYDIFQLLYLHLNNLYGEEKMIDFLLDGISEDCNDYYATDGLNTDFKMYFGEEIDDVYKSWVNNL